MDVTNPIGKKTYESQTSLSEVLIGLFMFLFGVLSLAFLAFYSYFYILNGRLNNIIERNTLSKHQLITEK